MYYAFSSRVGRNGLLLFASLLFYTWGEQGFVALMITSILMNFGIGRIIEKQTSNWMAAVGVTLNLALLAYFKYFNFLFDSLNEIASLGEVQLVHLPIGISFFTFQSISYILDVNRGTTKAQKNVFDLALYVALFPQLIAGPIIRYHDVAHQIRHRKESYLGVFYGLKRFLLGLAQKVLIANPLGKIANDIFALPNDELGTSLAWLAAIAYTFQIFFDFSGYSDMAIGIGRMFGFKFLENFNYPYISNSIKEFWRRWHISLSNWFRDYLYIPLGGSRKGGLMTYVNLWIVFLLCGLWHGASWTFIWWGVYHGFFLILERVLILPKNRLLNWVGHIYTLLVVVVGWVIFNSNNMEQAGSFLSKMFSYHDSGVLILKYMHLETFIYLALAIIFSTPFIVNMKHEIAFEKRFPILNASVQSIGMILLIGITMLYVASDTFNPFLYFRF